MAAPSLSLTLEDQLTIHFKEIGEKRLNSQAWPRSPIMEMMTAKAKPYKGGAYIQEQLEDGYEPTGSAVDEGSDMPASQPNLTIAAMYQPRWVVETLYLDGIKQMKIADRGDMGPILNWVQEQVDKKGRQIRENLARMLCLSTTGSAADGSTNPTSLFDIVKATGSLGGVDPTSYSWWASVVDNTAGAFSSTGPSRIRTALRTARKYTGFSGPTCLFVSGTAHDAMKAHGYTKTGYVRAPDASMGAYELGDPKYHWSAHAPFEPDFMVEGIPTYYDSHLDALESSSISTGGLILGINDEAVFMRQRSGSVFSVEKFRDSERKLGTYTRILYGGTPVCINRSSNILITSIT